MIRTRSISDRGLNEVQFDLEPFLEELGYEVDEGVKIEVRASVKPGQGLTVEVVQVEARD